MTAAGSGATGVERPAMAGWMLRALLAAAVLGLLVATLLGGSGTGALTIAGLVLLATGVGTVLRPDSAGAVFLLLISMAVHLLFDGAELNAGVAVLAALIAVVHQLAGICAAVPLDARVDLIALRPAAVRLAVAVLLVEAAILVAAIVS